jgi:hypothetical protein
MQRKEKYTSRLVMLKLAKCLLDQKEAEYATVKCAI